MTLISWYGGPIFRNGAVGTEQACCCGDPCLCPDWCLYQFSVVSPVDWGPRPPIPCQPDPNSSSVTYFDGGLFGPCEDPGQCCGPVTEPGAGLYDGDRHLVYADAGSTFATVMYSSSLGALAVITAQLRCDTSQSPVVVYLDVQLSVFVPGAAGLVFRTPTRTLRKYATAVLPTTCVSKTDASCADSGLLTLAAIDAPIEFTVTSESAGIAEWNESLTVDSSIGTQDRVTPCYDHLVDNFSATLRLTARENCLPPCEPCPRQQLCHDLHENFPETLAVGLDTCQNYSANEFGDDGVTADGGEYYLGGPTFGIGIFEPGGSPFLSGAFAKIEDRYVDLGGGNWELQRTTTPQTIDDCNNDGTDCNWADYEKALEYWDQGADIFVWGDLGVTTESSGGGLGPNGSASFMNAYHYKFRAYVSCDGGWVDKTAELLKRTELKYYYLVVGGAQSVEIPVTYRSPLQPGIVCLENPLP